MEVKYSVQGAFCIFKAASSHMLLWQVQAGANSTVHHAPHKVLPGLQL